jgi:hypothetical protein
VHAMALIALLGGGLIHATAHHPVYATTTKTFTYAASLRPGDKLLEPSGSEIPVTKVTNFTADLTAYNLDVTGIHTYYALAASTPVLVHNSCGSAAEDTVSAGIARPGRQRCFPRVQSLTCGHRWALFLEVQLGAIAGVL